MFLKGGKDKFFLKRKKRSIKKFNWIQDNSLTNKQNDKFKILNSKIKKNNLDFQKTFKKRKMKDTSFKINKQKFCFLNKLNSNLKKRSSINVYLRGSIFKSLPKIKHEEIIREKIVKMLIKKKKKNSILQKKRKAVFKNKSKHLTFINIIKSDRKFSKKNRKNHSLDLNKLDKKIYLKKKKHFFSVKKTKKIQFMEKNIKNLFFNIQEIKLKKKEKIKKKILAKNLFKNFQNFQNFKHLIYYKKEDNKIILPEIGSNLHSFS